MTHEVGFFSLLVKLDVYQQYEAVYREIVTSALFLIVITVVGEFETGGANLKLVGRI